MERGRLIFTRKVCKGILLLKEILVNVKANNHGAVSFWRKLGFVEADIDIINGLITMSMGL